MRLYGFTARALRFYEEQGLIEARRDRLNARYYEPDARRRLDWIAPLRRVGVSLDEIRDVLEAEDEEGRRELALRAIARRKQALEAQLDQARDARETLRARPGPEPRRAGLRSRA
jgi:DNA-binding transcriptional MerR regulator